MQRNGLRRVGTFIATAIFAGGLAACGGSGYDSAPPDAMLSQPIQAEIAVTSPPEERAEQDGAFSLTMLDVGQGLSILVQADGEYLLYDGGGRGRSSYVVSFLKQQQVTELTWLVASHYDEDHISGLVGVLHTTPVEQALMPDYASDTQVYQSLQEMLEEKAVPVLYPRQGDTFSLGDAEIQVVGPQSCIYGEDNDNSLCLRISYGEFSCLMTGDAEREAEHDLVVSGQEVSCDLYVVGHHGSDSSSSKELLDAAAPDYAFLSVGADNAYGHPAEDTLSALRQRGVRLFRTDKQKEVSVYSDGETYWFSTDPCQDWSPGEGTQPTASPAITLPQANGYILNTHTKVVHLPDCASVKQMSEKNKKFSSATLEDILADGYTPCGRCLE